MRNHPQCLWHPILEVALLCLAFASLASAAPRFHLSGVVVDERSVPIEAAYVGLVLTEPLQRALARDPQLKLNSLTDAAGRFTLLAPGGLGDYQIVARKIGRAPAWAMLTGEGSSTIRLVSPPGVKLVGSVIAEDLKPIAEAVLIATRQDEPEDTTPKAAKEIRSKSASRGRFELDGLAAGKYRITVEARRFVVRTLADVGVPSRPIQITLAQGAYLHGRVRDAGGNPIAEASLVATFGGGQRVAGRSARDGQFQLGPFPVGTSMELVASAPGFIDTRNDDAIAPNSDVVILMDRTGALHGRVLEEETERPVKQFRIAFHRKPLLPQLSTPHPGERTFTSEQGRFEWPDLRSGLWTITVFAAGFQPQDVEGLFIAPGGAQDLVVRLNRGYTVSGRVADGLTGTHVAGAMVIQDISSAAAIDPGLQPPPPRASTDSSGRFSLGGLPRDVVTLRVIAAGYLAMTSQAAPATNDFLEIALSRGNILVGRLVGTDRSSPIRGTVTLFDTAEQSFRTVATDEAGEFTIPAVAPGRHRIHGETDKGRTEEVELLMSAGSETKRIVLALAQGTHLTGTVSGLKPGEGGLSAVQVAGAAGFHADVPVSVEGSYEVFGVPAGPASVTATTPLNRKMAKEATFDGTTPTNVDFQFPAGHRVVGVVTRSGKPARFVKVSATPLDGQDVSSTGETSQSGQYVIEGIESGTYLLAAEGRSKRAVISGQQKVDFELSDLIVAGHVRRADTSAPLSAVTVELRAQDPKSPHARISARTDHAGGFSFNGLERGNYSLTAFKPGFDLVETAVSVEQATSDIELALAASGGVPVRVRDAATRRPLTQMMLIEIGGKGSQFDFPLDRDGYARIPSGLHGRTLIVWHPAYESITVDRWDGRALDLQLAPATAH